MRRAASVLFFCGLLGFAQEPVEFEVASIRSSNPDEKGGPSGCQTGSGLMRCSNVTLKRSIQGAYSILPDDILGGPDWIDTDRYQITARAGQLVGDKALMEMLQALLAERFNLKLHRERRPGESMVLEIAKNGAKLQGGGDAKRSYTNGHDRFDATALTMSDFAEVLTRNLRIPVVDRTGLPCVFTFTLRWNPDPPTTLAPDEAVAYLRSEVSRAVAQQLGLTLRSQRLPVEVLVIDHAEKPTEN